jgi:retron-type reverse transcriptase
VVNGPGKGELDSSGAGQEPVFHPNSYGYRPNKSALDAVGQARKRCLEMDWVIYLDIRDFFGSLDHELVMKALRHRTEVSGFIFTRNGG